MKKIKRRDMQLANLFNKISGGGRGMQDWISNVRAK